MPLPSLNSRFDLVIKMTTDLESPLRDYVLLNPQLPETDMNILSLNEIWFDLIFSDTC